MSRPQLLSIAETAALLHPRDTLAVPLGPGQPRALLRALSERDDWQDLQVFSALLIDGFELFARPGVRLRSGFFGPIERALVAAGHGVDFVPADFRRFTRIAADLAPRVFATAAAPGLRPDELSLSLHAGATVEELHRCARDPDRLLVVECSSRLPRTHGIAPEYPHAIALDEIDVLVETDEEPFILPSSPPGDVERAIADNALAYVESGATLQTGIGGIPDQIVHELACGPLGDFGIHTEMFTTSLMRLHEAGKVCNQKGLFDGVSVATFAAGTAELNGWLDRNERVRFLPVHAINAPGQIARNRNMLSINGALAVDLFGQVAADVLPRGQFSGIGGHEDFTSGAGMHGRSLICMPATAGPADAPVSRIHAALPAGIPATTPRHQVDVVVTEYGSAELAGRSVGERARALARIAAPAFRDALLADFEQLSQLRMRR